MTSATPALTQCPGCSEPLEGGELQNFCSACGRVLRQACPQCTETVDTPSSVFTQCQNCHTDLWSCPECCRIYHLDRATCQNDYCPDFGRFWTTRFGEDSWDGLKQSVPQLKDSQETPKPAWLGGADSNERRWPSLHTSGLLVSVLESGLVELWSEKGAPHPAEGDSFLEHSVCLSRLDLGEDAVCAPLFVGDKIHLWSTESLWELELGSNPALCLCLDLPSQEKALAACAFADSSLVVTRQALWKVSPDSRKLTKLGSITESPRREIYTDGRQQAILLDPELESCFSYHPETGLSPLPSPELNGSHEWALFADQLLLFRDSRLARLQDGAFVHRDLPDRLISAPLYCPETQLLYLFLADNTLRSCTTTGERFSFVCELAGSPSTRAIKAGERFYYGTEGRYLCRDEESLRPRLSTTPYGSLSYANGRLFGICKDGGLFSFQI